MQLNNILLIDDDDATCLILKAMLSKNNIVKKFNFCLGGMEALEFLRQSELNNDFPQVIFVDLNMPGMSGYEFIPIYEERFYKKHPQTKLAVVTSSMRVKDQQQSLSFESVTKFITKPLTTEKIRSMVE
jgi:CheY-like chemotaxis protein